MKRKLPTATLMPASQVALPERPGEFSHYFVNLLTLFGDTRPVHEIEAWSHTAVAARNRAIERFAHRLEVLEQDFLSQRASSGHRAVKVPSPRLRNWDIAHIESLRRTWGGLLIALFHYGDHRQVFLDMALQGIPFVAPVAKHAYFECTRVTSIAPESFEQTMRLLEVEDPRVGRMLVKSVREGRIGVIYVDGNMGPDGHRVEEGAVEVGFLGRRIRVKAGIARLSQALRLPVLPMSVRALGEGAGEAGAVRVGQVLLPEATANTSSDKKDAVKVSMMQSIYDFLAEDVVHAPAAWEFAFCLHRWLVSPPSSSGEAASDSAMSGDEAGLHRARVQLSPQKVALFSRSGEEFWVHVGRQKAYRLPPWANGLFGLLRNQSMTLNETERWLMAHNATASDTRSLLKGLVSRGLLTLA
jgi:lauroyl/myristoyl acyltransferase